MHPRTVAIIAVAVLVGAFVLRFLVVRFGLLPVSEEVVLKKAGALTIYYFDGGKKVTTMVTDSSQLSALLSTLEIKKGDGNGQYWAGNAGGSVGFNSPKEHFVPMIVFHFPRRQASFQLTGPRALGGYEIDDAFYKQVNEVLSQHRGHPVDILKGP